MALANLAANLFLALAFGQSQQHIPIPTPDNRYRPEPAIQADQNQVMVMPIPKFDKGMVTRYSANAIPPNSLSEALNVLVDEDIDGVIVRRNGYAKFNATGIEDLATVRGAWSFDAPDGTKYLVVNSSESFFQTIGDGSFSKITGLEGFSVSKDFDCVQALGKLWCLNGVDSFYWDGTSTKALSLPLGSMIDTFRNRLVVGGIDGEQSRIRLSGELNGEDFTLGTKSTSPANIDIAGINDGASLKCVMGPYQDVFLLGKDKALFGLYGFNRNDFVLREFSREVGCIEDRSVQEKNNCFYWLSKRGVERFCGTVITRVSDPIRDQIDEIIDSAGNSRSILDTAQANFEAGTLEPEPGIVNSATLFPGSITPSTFTISIVNTSTLTLVETATGTVSGSISLQVSTGAEVWDNFDDGDFTANPLWEFTDGANHFSIGGPCATGSLCYFKNAESNSGTMASTYSAPVSTGSWNFTSEVRVDNPDGINDRSRSNVEYFFLADKDSTQSGDISGYSVIHDGLISGGQCVLVRYDNGSATTLDSDAGIGSGNNSSSVCTFTIERQDNGSITVTATGGTCGCGNLSATDTTYSGEGIGRFALVRMRNYAVQFPYFFAEIDDIKAPYQFEPSGHFTSGVFDTGFSTPTSGIITISSTVPANTTINYLYRTSSSTTGNFGSFAPFTNDSTIPNLKRYVEFRSSFTSSARANSPTITAATFKMGTTGYFIHQCFNTSSINSWGTLDATTVNKDGNVTFGVTSGSSCNQVTRATATFTAQNNHAVINVATNTFLGVKTTFDGFSVFYETATPLLSDLTINWNESGNRPSVSSIVHKDRYYLSYTTSTASGAFNDHALVLDRNDRWTLFDDWFCYSSVLYRRNYYCGASTSSGQVWQMDVGTDDDGSGFTSRIRTKAFDLHALEKDKIFEQLYLVLEPEPNDSDSITLTARYSIDRSTETFSLSTVDLGEATNSLITAKFPFGLDDPISGKFITLEIESTGSNQPWKLYDGKLFFRYLKRD